MDPPWPENGGGKIKRGADRHYATVPVKQLPKLILDSGVFTPAESAHLWMWATKNYLEGALWLMGQLGFRYVTDFVWVKLSTKPVGMVSPTGEAVSVLDVDAVYVARHRLQIGLGQYSRGAHELLLFGTRGDAMVPAPEDRLPDVFFAERTEHSVKPAEAYEIIERVSPGPRLEMFARAARPGWDVWGSEAPQTPVGASP